MSLLFATLLTLAAAPSAPEDVAPSWVTFEVINPEVAGRHRILHLEDVLAAKSAIPDLPSARVLLVFSVLGPECKLTGGVCAELAALTKELAGQGVVVIGVLLDPLEALPRVKKELASVQPPFVLAADAHGITRRALGLTRPGELLLVGSSGRVTRFGAAGDGPGELRQKLEDVKRVVLQALKKDKEDGP